MLNQSKIMTFVATTQPHAARGFYEKVLGLRFVADEDYALVFDANGTMLRIQKTDQVSPPPYTSLGWQVTDIVASVRELGARGVIFERYGFLAQDELGIWSTGDGAKV